MTGLSTPAYNVLMYQKTTLSNGLRVLTNSIPGAPSVSVLVGVSASPRYERDEEAGISHVVEHLCFKGTPTRPSSRKLCEPIEGVGGIFNGGTDKEMTVYWSKVAKMHFDLALDVLTDMVLHPLFAPDDIEKERSIILEEIDMTNDSPQQRVDMVIDELLWPNQALGRDIAGTKESVSSISREMMLDYWACQYSPGRTVVSIAGDVEHEQVVEKLAGYFSAWPDSRVGRNCNVADNGQDIPRLRLEHRATEQAHLSLAVHGYSSRHPERYSLDVLNVILGEGMSSRLFEEVREKRGLAYDVHSYVSRFLDSGALTVYAGVDPDKTEETISAILHELDRMKTDVPEAELGKAKEFIKGRLLLGMEDSRAVAGWVARQELLLERVLTVDEVVARIDGVTADGVRKVARDLFRTPMLSLALVGPGKNGGRLKGLLKL